MVAVLLGLAASASFSCADFFGGVAARRSNAWLSVLANQVIGLIPLTVYLLLLLDGLLIISSVCAQNGTTRSTDTRPAKGRSHMSIDQSGANRYAPQ